ncbi:carbon-nitrogen hydrolase family protein [Sulfurimonas paralvinellae]|uniref:Carbon-nitrogen hydrolase family protein n=1 Tax=Sulfurimonas paralvinellae TaxID=317658 RepID=A0A7M1B4X1_9BACT|nr:carbon-nitrogen hydrolase family protein [Sulfurimonas paralvinellae]QOP44779.1 carbon-nitrogen hydrolase family protein [Sulfurimonas paralvinellae]
MTTSKTSGEYALCSLLFETTPDYEKNLQTLLGLISETNDKSLIVAPEVCLTSYDYENMEVMLRFAPHATAALKKASRKKIIILTMLEEREGEVYNFAKVFYNGGVVYERAKAKLFRFGDEHKYMKEGSVDDFEIIEVDGIKIAVFICFELRFKELWCQSEGADVIAVSSWWGELRSEHFKILTQALALMNQCYVVASDSKNSECTRLSGIIDPQGKEQRNGNTPCLTQAYSKKEISLMRRYMDVGIG